MLTMQDALRALSAYWTSKGCMTWQPFNTEVGAGTMNPATVLRVLGPEPWNVAYAEPSVRPDDSRYGENPMRLQTFTQFQVVLKPEPGNPQDLYLGSLEALGIDLDAHDVRFVEDNWQQPAIGAWGLGWEVWLDGMEISQFTYFQQVGGQDLDPVSVELTYGVERIVMALQGVENVHDIAYALTGDGSVVTYAEAFGQQEYEMSRYYLDDADTGTARRLYEAYTEEAGRMVAARLPVPAHQYVLKASHAFNILDSRGAISTTERAKAFSTMRRLMRETGALWVERREELGLPLLRERAPALEPTLAIGRADALAGKEKGTETFALEIGVEELPPHVVNQTVDMVREALTRCLSRTRLSHGELTVDGSPRRIVALLESVGASEPDATTLRKGPKWSAAFDREGNPTRALEGFTRSHGSSVDRVVSAEFGNVTHAALEVEEPGRDVITVLTEVVQEVVSGLRADKNMRWNDPELSFSRPVRWLLAMWGTHAVPARVSGLTAGNATQLHRATRGRRQGTDVHSEGDSAIGLRPVGRVEVAAADRLPDVLRRGGIEWRVASRRATIRNEVEDLATENGGRVLWNSETRETLEEVANLVEEPHAVLGRFDAKYLDLPDRVLTTVMRKHQRYFPVHAQNCPSADGEADATLLLPCFVAVANGVCDDDTVRRGNEAVIRARYEDALFFWDSDLQVGSVEDFVPRLEGLTFERRLGSVGQRARRIGDVASEVAGRVSLCDGEREVLERAGRLAKFDLGTQLVAEMSSLAGFVAREYAVRKGESAAVAQALYDMELPRTSSDALPETASGALLAVADRADLIISMTSVGSRAKGSSDPFGLRRAALGLVRILRGCPVVAGLSIQECLDIAAMRLSQQGVPVPDGAAADAEAFVRARFAQLLRDEGIPAHDLEAVAPSLGWPAVVAAELGTIARLRGDESFIELVSAVMRCERIVPAGTAAGYDRGRLTEPAEMELVAALSQLPGDGSTSLEDFARHCASLAGPVNRFFAHVLVMSPDPELRAARLGLLSSVRSRFPRGLNIASLELSLG